MQDCAGYANPLLFTAACIVNGGDQDPSILINGFGESYGDAGWMQNWDTCNHRRRNDEAWFGQMSLPRELHIRNGRLYQNPIRELEQMRRGRTAYENITVSGTVRLDGIRGRRVDMEL